MIEHLAIIMDGNGRWATKRGLSRSDGHRAGAENIRRVVDAAREMGIKYLTVYAFSTENWKRPVSEVAYLMGLIGEFTRKISLSESRFPKYHFNSRAPPRGAT